MLALLALVVTVGLADAINPSTIVPALYYATTARARSALIAFACGALIVYFVGGALVLFGGKEIVTSLLPHIGERAEHLAEVGGGTLLLAVAAVAWLMRDRVADHAARPRTAGPRSAFALGAGIMAVELPTAFPYFAVIATIAASNSNVAAQLGLVALYNLLFILPLLGLLAARAVAGERGERLLQSMRLWVQRHAAAVLAATLSAIGLAGIVIGAAGLA